MSVRLTSDHLKLAGEEVCETHIVKGQQHNVNGQQEDRAWKMLVTKTLRDMLN